MKPLLSPPGLDPTPAETAVPFTPARPPASVQVLRFLLLAATAFTILTWAWAWQGVQAYAWPGVDNGLAERGLAYLLILAPAVPVNLVAAIGLTRGARHYLAAAAALAAVQVVLLLTPSAMPLTDAMSDGTNAVGIRHLVTVGPLLLAGIWIATATKAREWLGTTPKPRSRFLIVEAAVWCLALALAFNTGAEVRQWTQTAAEPAAPDGEYDEAGTWASLELAVTETTDAIPSFPGFTTRTLDVAPCDYYTPAGLPTYRYLLTYELREPADAPIAARWAKDDFHLTYDGETLEGTRRITAERTFPFDDGRGTYPTENGVHAITLAYTEAGTPTLHLESPCVERSTEPTECILPQGDPTTDTITGITCPRD
ncbi:hypothetical protein [Glycomyces rhizosphaerae]|uniref:DUF2637 domain-containing protein n=1 Tax=Glycomyces rhizosphaerae TaxID=2054422 RepID=A0ABV7PUS3_9ACTN